MGIEFVISAFEDGYGLTESVRKGMVYDVILMDINLEKENGIEVAKNVMSLLKIKPYLVFITGRPDRVYNALSAHPFHFIKKPTTVAELSALFTDIGRDMDRNRTLMAIADTFTNEITFDPREPVFIRVSSSSEKTLEFSFPDRSFVARGRIRDWEDSLKPLGYFRPNRETLINLRYLRSLKYDELELSDGTCLPLSRGKYQELKGLCVKGMLRL